MNKFSFLLVFKKKFYIILGVLALIAIDFLSKKFFNWYFQNIVFGNNENLYSYFPIFGDIFGIKLVYNQWIAFGLPINWIFLKIITFAIIFGLIYYYIRYEFPKNKKIIDISFVFIFAGALSHLYERVFVWYVIDFLSLKYFAIFNFADVYITIWAIIFILYNFYYESSRWK